jgi:hypothetical protein
MLPCLRPTFVQNSVLRYPVLFWTKGTGKTITKSLITMSKDKGSKNHKKAPADRSGGKGKSLSPYQAEGKSDATKQPTLEAFIPKTNTKVGGNKKA